MSTVNGLTFHVFSGSTVSVSPFPVNATPLDAFTNRTSLGGNWNSNGGGFAVVNNAGTANDYLRIRTGIAASATPGGPPVRPSAHNQEAYFTFVKTFRHCPQRMSRVSC